MQNELLKRVRLLRPIDDILFEVLIEDKALCEELLRIVLEDAQLLVKEVIPQKSERNLFGRSVRLDALCVLGDGRKCNIEVQRSDDDDHLRRARYNASVVTARCSEPGIHFRDIPTVIVVYISEWDIFGGGRTVYHIDSVIREMGKEADDGFARVFVNTAVDDGTDIAEYMRCMKQQMVDNPRFLQLTRRMHEVKDMEGGLTTMSKLSEELIAEGMARGFAKGREEGREVAFFMLVSEGDISLELGAKRLGRTPEEFRKAMQEKGYTLP